MSIGEWAAYKFRAVRTLWRMMRWLSNWREVWSQYRAQQPLPPLHFRSGLTLHHGPHDSPIALLHEVFGEGQYRRHLSSAVEGVMIDLGANVGAVTLDWAKRSRGLRVHAYEPNPETNTVLRHNIEVNGFADRITVYDEAVGGESGELRLWTNVNSMTATSYCDGPPTPEAVATPVSRIDLNEVIRRVGDLPVSLLKMDTEGAEADTLDGASATTLKAIRQVVLEYHDGLCPNAAARCKRTLERAGFRCLVQPINPAHGLMYAWRTDL
jgi:FkbM family methyltransferase